MKTIFWRRRDMCPVRARLVARPEDWPWSSARAHLAGLDDGLVTVGPLRDRIGDVAGITVTVAITPNLRRCAKR